MADMLKKINPGDPLVIPATTFNTFVDAAKAIVKKPVAVYVKKVYEEGNFGGLGDRGRKALSSQPISC